MGGSSRPTTTQTTQYQMSPEERQLFNLAMPFIQQYGSTPIQQFGGTGIAPFNPLELQAQQEYINTAAPQAQNLVTQAAGTQSQLLNPEFMLNPNPYIKRAAEATAGVATDNLTQNILPQIRSGSTQAGGAYSGGSTREGVAEGLATAGTGRAISDAVANMYLSNYNTGLTNLGAALERNPSVASSQLFPADIMAAVGGQQRSMEQAQLDEQIRSFYTAQDLPLLQSQQLLQLLGGIRNGANVSTGTGAVPGVSPLQAIGGLAGAGVGAYFGGPMGASVGGSVGSQAGAGVGGAK